MENKKALIYKLSCNVTGKVYYGSTTRTISHRISRHKTSFRLDRGCRSKEIIENWDYKTEVLEEVNLENRLERESYYIKNFDCVNKKIPLRTKKEFMKEYDKERNKEKYTCQCGIQYTRQHKARHEKSQKHIKYLESKTI